MGTIDFMVWKEVIIIRGFVNKSFVCLFMHCTATTVYFKHSKILQAACACCWCDNLRGASYDSLKNLVSRFWEMVSPQF